MSKRGEGACIFWFVILAIYGLIEAFNAYPWFLIYIALGLFAIILFLIILNFCHTVYLLNFNSRVKKILKFDEKKFEVSCRGLLERSKKANFDVDEEYFNFINNSKIFDRK